MSKSQVFFLSPMSRATREDRNERIVKNYPFSDLSLRPNEYELELLDEWYHGSSEFKDSYEESEFIGKRWQYVWSHIVALIWATEVTSPAGLGYKIKKIHELYDSRIRDIRNSQEYELNMEIRAIEQMSLRKLLNKEAKMPEAERGPQNSENLIPSNIIIRFEFEADNEIAFEKKSEWDPSNKEWKNLPRHEVLMRVPKKPASLEAVALAQYSSNLRAHPFTLCLC